MRLMTILGSPRKGGNTEALADAAIEGFKSCGHKEATKISIIRSKIKYCNGCLKCLFPQRTGKCILKDDMAAILEEMKDHDAFLFATPNHQHNVSAPMLNFISRMLPLISFRPVTNRNGELIFREFSSDIKGKRVGFVGSQGDPYLFTSLVLPFLDKVFDDYKLVKVADFTSLGNVEKGSVAKKKRDLEKAFEVGVKLGS